VFLLHTTRPVPDPTVELGKRVRLAPHRDPRYGIRRGLASADGAANRLRIAVPIPTSGAAGIWGPSCLACATLATDLWNAAGGFKGREVHLTILDASDESASLEDELRQLVEDEAVDAVVGMHTSSVRERIGKVVNGSLPFIYTPLYEGGALPAGVLAIGETPEHQLLPAMNWLIDSYRLKRWYLVGNDYIWPRRSHAIAAQALAGAGCRVVGSRYVALGNCDVERLIDEIRRCGAQAVLMSLVGQDAVEFCRAFGAAGLSGRIVRLSCAIEENGLLAMGSKSTAGLFAASGYFASLETDANGAFKERYWSRFGDRAPVLNALGQSTYEGVAFLRGLLERGGVPGSVVDFDSARATRWRSNSEKATPIYLAEADGISFRVTKRLGPHPA
jgi:urea transport system substrate-binding protein